MTEPKVSLYDEAIAKITEGAEKLKTVVMGPESEQEESGYKDPVYDSNPQEMPQMLTPAMFCLKHAIQLWVETELEQHNLYHGASDTMMLEPGFEDEEVVDFLAILPELTPDRIDNVAKIYRERHTVPVESAPPATAETAHATG